MDVKIENVSCSRGDRTVLSNVSFHVKSGRALILRGANGAGKTTLLRCLAGLTPPITGALSFSPDDVAYSAHADGLKSQMSVAETLEFWGKVYGAADIMPAVGAFDLKSLLDRKTQFLSAGQKRRLSLARMVLTRRAIWVMDEPTVSLDAHAVSQFARAVETHLSAGGTAIIATHIELGLHNAAVLDIGTFQAEETVETDPFLDEAFL